MKCLPYGSPDDYDDNGLTPSTSTGVGQNVPAIQQAAIGSVAAVQEAGSSSVGPTQQGPISLDATTQQAGVSAVGATGAAQAVGGAAHNTQSGYGGQDISAVQNIASALPTSASATSTDCSVVMETEQLAAGVLAGKKMPKVKQLIPIVIEDTPPSSPAASQPEVEDAGAVADTTEKSGLLPDDTECEKVVDVDESAGGENIDIASPIVIAPLSESEEKKDDEDTCKGAVGMQSDATASVTEDSTQRKDVGDGADDVDRTRNPRRSAAHSIRSDAAIHTKAATAGIGFQCNDEFFFPAKQ